MKVRFELCHDDAVPFPFGYLKEAESGANLFGFAISCREDMQKLLDAGCLTMEHVDEVMASSDVMALSEVWTPEMSAYDEEEAEKSQRAAEEAAKDPIESLEQILKGLGLEVTVIKMADIAGNDKNGCSCCGEGDDGSAGEPKEGDRSWDEGEWEEDGTP